MKRQSGMVKIPVGRFSICFAAYLAVLLLNISLIREVCVEDCAFIAIFLFKDFLLVGFMCIIVGMIIKAHSGRKLNYSPVILMLEQIVNVGISILIVHALFGEIGIEVMFAIELSVLYNVVASSICCVKMVNDEHLNNLSRLEMEKHDLELYYLNLQLNPHFLFNTLNVIYVQSRKEKARNTADMVMSLSDLLRYQLYESVDKKVMLKSEVKFLENYIDLQKMRQMDIDIDYKKEGDFDGVMIYPFLCISFLENAFKYVNVNKDGEKNINILIAVEKKNVFFVVRNTMNEESQASTSERSSKIGIQNAKKRLELLYNGKYELNIDSDGKYFNVELKIEF